MSRKGVISRGHIDTITAALRDGSFLRYAVESTGITMTSYYRWMALGRRDIAQGEEETLFAALVRETMQARADTERALASCILQAARNGDWKAASWLLSRSFPEWTEKSAASPGVPTSPEVISGAIEELVALTAGLDS
ncbi:hypothetical protein [Frankia sp. Cj3]|uniref:hypothetical protein n=1 Tax=Frankia sp. Cj3 TaxID=2880976 RepID=UPI001EF5D1CE|nr:hypothetical protein [Frankia sp. Cj3]